MITSINEGSGNPTTTQDPMLALLRVGVAKTLPPFALNPHS